MSVVAVILLTYCTLTPAISSTIEDFNNDHCYSNSKLNNYTACNNDSSCPTWFYCQSTTCQCGARYYGMIACSEAIGRAAVSNCHCVTYDNITKATQVGSCYYNCENTARKTLYDRVYHPLPRNPTELTVNRRGHS